MTRGHELAMALRAAYWAMHRRADALFGRHGVTADQFVLLSFLNEEDGISQQELVRRATHDANTVRRTRVALSPRASCPRVAPASPRGREGPQRRLDAARTANASRSRGRERTAPHVAPREPLASRDPGPDRNAVASD